jgi:hypothetical protein
VKPTYWKVLAAAALTGVAGDYLLRGAEWRLGFALWIALLAVCAAVLVPQLTRERALLLVGATLAAFGLVWRDAELLYAIDTLSLLCMGALTIWHGSGKRMSQLSVVEVVRAGVLAVANTVSGAAGVIEANGEHLSSAPAARNRRRAIFFGCVLAAPPFLLVASLLISSDAVFSTMVDQFVSTVAADGIRHLFVASFLAWMAAGWLRSAAGDSIGSTLLNVRSPGLPWPSVGVALYALSGLLVLFEATQVRVLFGGAEYLRATTGLTVANYARAGFFQMVVAAGIVLGTLVIAEWLIAADNAAGRRRYRVAGGILLTLVATLLISAASRIWLYMREFGLSIDRAFASAAIVWVLVALIAFAATTLRDRADRFAPIAVYCTIGWVVLLNLVNPEARVVNVNMSRAARGAAFDIPYHAALSADAVPALLHGAHGLSAADCQAVESALRETWRRRWEVGTPESDWRRWNLPEARVGALLASGASCGKAAE